MEKATRKQERSLTDVNIDKNQTEFSETDKNLSLEETKKRTGFLRTEDTNKAQFNIFINTKREFIHQIDK